MVYTNSVLHINRLSGVVVRTAQVIAINALRQIITDNPPIGEQTGFIKQLGLLILLVIGNLNLFLIVELVVGNFCLLYTSGKSFHIDCINRVLLCRPLCLTQFAAYIAGKVFIGSHIMRCV